MSSQHAVKRQGKGQRLNDRQRMEIISLLEQSKPQSMRSIARQFGVDEKTIRRVKLAKDIIRKRAQNAKQATQETIFRQAMFPELENKLAEYIDEFYRTSHIVLSSMEICHRAKLFAETMGIPDDKFKASSNWLDRFLHRHDLKFSNLFGEREVDRNNLEVALIESNDEYDGSSSDKLESNDESDGSLSDNKSTEVNLKFQLDAILKSLRNAWNLEISMDKLESNDESDGSLSDNQSTEVNLNFLLDAQLKLLENVWNLESSMDKLQDSLLLTDQIKQANSVLLMLKRILVTEPLQFTNPYYP